jgi:hypothetical protein
MLKWISGAIFGAALGFVAYPVMFLRSIGDPNISEIGAIFFCSAVFSYVVFRFSKIKTRA